MLDTAAIFEKLKSHNEGKTFSTRGGRPWDLVYYEAYKSEELARRCEDSLKHNRGRGLQLLYKRITK